MNFRDKVTLVFTSIQTGEPVRADTIMQRTKLERSEVGPILARLCNSGRLVKLCRGVYAVAGNTPPLEQFAREIRQAEQSRRSAKRKASQDRYRAKLLEARAGTLTPFARNLASIKHAPESLVQSALAKQPALVTVWGGSCNA